jgi:hypothetical protein
VLEYHLGRIFPGADATSTPRRNPAPVPDRTPTSDQSSISDPTATLLTDPGSAPQPSPRPNTGPSTN